MAKYLVTGGAGFIGSHIARSLVRMGHEVIIVDLHEPEIESNHVEGATIRSGSITNVEFIRSLFDDSLAGCFHLAAVASVQKCNENWLSSHQINAYGAVNIMRAAVKYSTPILYASSAAVYGNNSNLPLKETEHPAPLTAYGVDKYADEMHGKVADTIHGIPNAGFRFFNVYGPGQDPKSPYSGVISLFIDKILNKQPIQINGDGEQSRDFIYVQDVADALIGAMKKKQNETSGHEVYNVCTGVPVSINELATIIEDIVGYKVQRIHAPERPGDIKKSLGDPSFLNQDLNFKAKVSLKEGLKKTIESIQQEIKTKRAS